MSILCTPRGKVPPDFCRVETLVCNGALNPAMAGLSVQRSKPNAVVCIIYEKTISEVCPSARSREGSSVCAVTSVELFSLNRGPVPLSPANSQHKKTA